MIRILILAIALTACSCSIAPIAPDAQQQLDSIRDAYAAARGVERTYDTLPACPALRQCADARLAEAVHRADYEASAAIVTADSERTAEAIAKARQATMAFAAAALELP